MFPLKVEAASIETRAVNGQSVEVLVGRAAVFDEFTPLRDRWGDVFNERFAAGCMSKTLGDGHKVMILYNHDWTCLLGSTADVITLTLKSDGLYFEYTPKNFEFDRRIVDLVRSGTIDGCSIGYRVTDHDWEEKDGSWFRTVTEIELYEISLTPIPAYEQTSVDIEVRKDAQKPEPPTDDAEERSKILSEANALLSQIQEVTK